MSILFVRKKEKKKDLDQAFLRVTKKIQEMDNYDDPKKLEHYILDSCEQIVRTTREIESERREYRVVTEYLKDIESLSNLSSDKSKELHGTAKKIMELDRSRSSYMKAPKRITEDNFHKMEEEEEDLPGIIDRMEKNEIYQERLRKDMSYLEGEKSRLEIERESYESSQKIVKILSVLLLVSFISLITLIFILEQVTKEDTSFFFLAVFVIGCFAAVGIFLKNQSNRQAKRRATKGLNNYIGLLNVIRMKYANVSRALEYNKERYDVRTAAELAYIFEQYQLTVKERDQYRRNNEDLDYYSTRLEKLLTEFELNDVHMWMSRVDALADHKEMVEVTHRLNERRSKIRDQIKENTEVVKMERDEIDHLMKEHQYYVPEVIEIIQSVDRICGLNQFKKRTPGVH